MIIGYIYSQKCNENAKKKRLIYFELWKLWKHYFVTEENWRPKYSGDLISVIDVRTVVDITYLPHLHSSQYIYEDISTSQGTDQGHKQNTTKNPLNYQTLKEDSKRRNKQ